MTNPESHQLAELLLIKQRRLHELEKTAALFGVETPPHISLEIEDLRHEIDFIKRDLPTTIDTNTIFKKVRKTHLIIVIIFIFALIAFVGWNYYGNYYLSSLPRDNKSAFTPLEGTDCEQTENSARAHPNTSTTININLISNVGGILLIEGTNGFAVSIKLQAGNCINLTLPPGEYAYTIETDDSRVNARSVIDGIFTLDQYNQNLKATVSANHISISNR
jgi:hypothetical protein